MTYCLAIAIDEGLVFCSDSRTNAGPDQVSAYSKMHRFPIGEKRVFVEPCPAHGRVVLAGAGHVARHVACLAAKVDFYTVVMDDREAFASRERFPEADELRVVPSFENCFTGRDAEADAYLVILTRGHFYDLDVLRQALRTDAGYIGMIGSKKKRDAIYRALREEGADPKKLEAVHSPIGLAIGAETPEEIAVSIVSELIRVRARRNR